MLSDRVGALTSHIWTNADDSDTLTTDIVGQRSTTTAVCIQVGANDVKDSGWDAVAFKTAYQTEITALVAEGISYISLGEVTGQAGAGQAIQDAIDEANAVIAELASENSQCAVAETFASMGGHSPINLVDTVHPDAKGQQIVGSAHAKALLSIA